jgi:hypothetical protein
MKKKSKPVFRCGLLVLILAAAGCVTGPEPVVVSPTQPLAADQVPWHAKAALAALIMRQRGASEAEAGREARADGTAAIKPEPKFRYRGFSARQIKIAGFSTPKGETARRDLSGYLHFQDAAGRRAAAFRLSYRVAGDRIAIAKAAWAPLIPKYPKVEMLVVPAKAFIAPKARPKDFHSLYALAAGNAVPMKTPAASGEARDYMIAVFVKDRIAPGAKLEVGISEVQDGPGSYTKETLYKAFDGGWGAAIIPGGRFSLSSSDAFWVKAVYTPGADTAKDQRSERVVGLFSTAPGPGAKKPPPVVPVGPPSPLKAAMAMEGAAGGTALDREMDIALRKARGKVASPVSSLKAAVNRASLPDIVFRLPAAKTAKGS